jgi:hypothetical protein
VLGKGFAECFPGFAECPGHSVKRAYPVVTVLHSILMFFDGVIFFFEENLSFINY